MVRLNADWLKSWLEQEVEFRVHYEEEEMWRRKRIKKAQIEEEKIKEFFILFNSSFSSVTFLIFNEVTSPLIILQF